MGAGLLDDVLVVELASPHGELAGRLLADLGADVVLVEPPSGAPARRRPPFVDGVSVSFATAHLNERSVLADLATPEGRETLRILLSHADVLIAPSARELSLVGLDLDVLVRDHSQLVIVSVSGFGNDGPYAVYQATDSVLVAMAGQLSRSGLPGRPPLLPPIGLAEQSAVAQAAWAALLGLRNRQETGHGDLVDFSLFEAAAQVLDPALGAVGTASAGQAPAALFLGRGRPASGLYPVYRCADGHVRLLLLAVRQWRAMLEWLGTPDHLADPSLDQVLVRMQRRAEVDEAIEGLLAGLTVEDAVGEGQRRGVPVAPVLTVEEVLSNEHYVSRGALVETEIAEGVRATVPNGVFEIDGERAGVTRRSPSVGEHTDEVLAELAASEPRAQPTTSRPAARAPLEGVRVLDLGVIVAGGEAGRLFADQGAEVIKVETGAFPDGSRASIPGPMTGAFASAHRNKLGLAINLRVPEGAALFERLVRTADVVLENFKPGTLERLGLGWERLSTLNPKLVLASSSAMGSTGPWATWMGYGPLVRSAAGLTDLWRDPDRADGFSDGLTIFPDHLVARLVDTAALAALMRARRTGIGAHIECAQAEVILAVLASTIAAESRGAEHARPGSGTPSAPWGVYPCAGDDEWCVISVRDDDDWQRLVGALGSPVWATDPALATTEVRVERSEAIDRSLAAWTSARTPAEVTEALQGVGVPAGFMRRVGEYLDDPHLNARRFFRHLDQPWVEGPVLTENGPCTSLGIAEPRMAPAPLRGQHTRELCRRILGLSDAEIDALVATGALEEADPTGDGGAAT